MQQHLSARQEVAISDFHEPHKFIPHITLGYIGDNDGKQKFPPVEVDAIRASDIIVSVKDGDGKSNEMVTVELNGLGYTFLMPNSVGISEINFS